MASSICFVRYQLSVCIIKSALGYQLSKLLTTVMIIALYHFTASKLYLSQLIVLDNCMCACITILYNKVSNLYTELLLLAICFLLVRTN